MGIHRVAVYRKFHGGIRRIVSKGFVNARAVTDLHDISRGAHRWDRLWSSGVSIGLGLHVVVLRVYSYPKIQQAHLGGAILFPEDLVLHLAGSQPHY